jgi:hypothetical protein
MPLNLAAPSVGAPAAPRPRSDGKRIRRCNFTPPATTSSARADAATRPAADGVTKATPAAPGSAGGVVVRPARRITVSPTAQEVREFERSVEVEIGGGQAAEVADRANSAGAAEAEIQPPGGVREQGSWRGDDVSREAEGRVPAAGFEGNRERPPNGRHGHTANGVEEVRATMTARRRPRHPARRAPGADARGGGAVGEGGSVRRSRPRSPFPPRGPGQQPRRRGR